MTINNLHKYRFLCIAPRQPRLSPVAEERRWPRAKHKLVFMQTDCEVALKTQLNVGKAAGRFHHGHLLVAQVI